MDQVIYASPSHTHYWYEAGKLKVVVAPVANIATAGQIKKIIAKWLGQCFLPSAS